MKYVKVMFSSESRYNGFQYKVGEVNIAPHWNPLRPVPVWWLRFLKRSYLMEEPFHRPYVQFQPPEEHPQK